VRSAIIKLKGPFPVYDFGFVVAGRCQLNTLRQATEDYLELRRGLGFKLVNYEAWLREFVSFLEKNNASHITTALAVQFALRDPHRRKLKLTGTLLCAVLPATEAVSIPQRRFLRVDWCEDVRGARVRIFILTRKSANCCKRQGNFPRRIACGLGPTTAYSGCWQ
jgi:hypothetical protein